MVNNFFKNICTSNIITLWCLVYISQNYSIITVTYQSSEQSTNTVFKISTI